MGIISTWLVARYMAKRAVERERARAAQARGTRVQTGMTCYLCDDPLVLSVDWPGIDPVYWEDWLQGICSNCYDKRDAGSGRVDADGPPDTRQAWGPPDADGPRF